MPEDALPKGGALARPAKDGPFRRGIEEAGPASPVGGG
jgi:hypothetical protein